MILCTCSKEGTIRISLTEFDLENWYQLQGLSQGMELTDKYTYMLYNDLNLSPYIGDSCQFSNSEMNISSLGWANGNTCSIYIPEN